VTIASGVGGPEPIVSPPFIPRPAWQPLGIGAGICPAWFFFQSDRDFENVDVYRFGGDWPDDNISDGPTSVDNGPTYSQDSEWVAFVSDRDFTGGKEIFIGKVDGTEQRRVTYSTATDINPAWGPEGRIAFETNRDGNWEIYTVNLSGYAVPQRLTYDPAYDTNARWSYDGKYVYFQSNRDGDWEIFRIEVLSGTLEQMTDNSLQDAYPIVSHDNNMLAWLQTDPVDGVAKLWLMDLATGESRNLTPDFTQDVERIVFSPDDALIAFHSRHNAESEQTDYEVYVVELATDRIKNITDNENIEDMEPNFWCSSLMVLFQSDRNEHEIPGEFDIFEVNPMPIEGPAAEASALVVDDVTNDADPLNTSRQGD
jgi:Tol biopolymer transport system component